MAKDAAQPELEGEAPPKKSKKKLIIIVAAVLVLAIGGAAAFFLLNGHGEDEEAAEETVKPKKSKKAEAPPVFLNLEPFTVNLVAETSDQYLQVTLSLELEGPETEQEIKHQLPKIRNNVTLLLSAKKASELLTKEGKEQLAEELKEEINTIANGGHGKSSKSGKGKKKPVPEGPVNSVLFTSFIIQ